MTAQTTELTQVYDSTEPQTPTDLWSWIGEVEAETGMVLSPSQRAGAIRLMQGLFGYGRVGESLPPKHWTAALAGYAGTGKTTLLRTILRGVKKLFRNNIVVLLAPTGKAAARMRDVLAPELELLRFGSAAEGVDGPRTVHSFVYGQGSLEAECPTCKTWSPELHEGIGVEGSEHARQHFCPKCETPYNLPIRTLKHRLAFGRTMAFSEEVTNVLIVVDESSMIDEKLAQDLFKVAKTARNPRVLFLGDPGQIPPVMGKPGIDLATASVMLTEIHRQQANNPIIALAAKLRSPVVHPAVPYRDLMGVKDTRYEFIRSSDPIEAAGAWLFQRFVNKRDAITLVGSHAARQRVNQIVRSRAGWRTPTNEEEARQANPYDLLHPGEQILMLANAHEAELMNGETAVVDHLEVAAPTPYSRALGLTELSLRLRNRPDRPYRIFPDLLVDSGSRDGGASAEFALRRKVISAVYNKHFDAWVKAVQNSPSHPAHETWEGGDLAALTQAFIDDTGFSPPGLYLRCTWGYCLTIHKSQGSEWQDVGLVLDNTTQFMAKKPDGHRLLYTATTRASENLRVFV